MVLAVSFKRLKLSFSFCLFSLSEAFVCGCVEVRPIFYAPNRSTLVKIVSSKEANKTNVAG